MPVSTDPEPPRKGTRDHGFHPVRVSRIIRETADAVSVELDIPPELSEGFAYRAGQFITLRVTLDGQTYLRSYSMSSSPETDTEFRVTVKQVPSGVVSTWITERLAPADVIDTTLPAGVFTLRENPGDVVAFAGGSGITPIFALLKTTLATTSRRVKLLYANRDPDSVIFREQLAELSDRYGERLEVVLHFDSEQGFAGAAEIGPYATSAAGSDYYVCGPGPFMDLVADVLEEKGVGADQIHIERFTPAPPAEVPPEAPLEAAAPSGTQVTITLDGKTVTATHRPGTTVLQTARSMGMTPPFSCEAGDCATCMAKVVEGAVTMFVNNALLEDEIAEGWVLTCQSVPTTPTLAVIYGYDD